MLSVEDKRVPSDRPREFNLASYVLWENGAPDDKVALTLLRKSGSERWSYGRLRDAVLRIAGGLLAHGLTPGDTVLLRLGNTVEFPLAFLGAVAAGLVPAPTSAALNGQEIDRIAKALQPKITIAGTGIALPSDASAVALSDLPRVSGLDAPTKTEYDDPAYIVFTSGTSGKPVGVVHAHRAIHARRFMWQGWYGLGSADRMLHAGAFNWTYTLGTGLMDPWSAGAAALVPASETAPDLLALFLRRHEASIFAASPGLFRRLLRVESLVLPNLRHGLSAGERLPDSLRRRWHEAVGTDIHEAFGQSECSTFISGSPERPAETGSLGFTQPGRAVAVLGDSEPVPRGTRGEIAVHRDDPGLMLGYLNGELPLDGDWFRTGDMAVMRDSGAIEYLGRKDDVLTAGGFRVSPVEIEEAMLEIVGIRDAAAVDHAIDGETVVIALHYASDAPLDEAILRAHAEAVLARHKQPRVFRHHAELPRNPNGKLLRRALKAANQIGE